MTLRRWDVLGQDVTVLALLRRRNRELLEKWLGEGPTVVTDEGGLPESFDVCVLDAAAYRDHHGRLGELKRAAEPEFLPFLLVIREGNRTYIDEEVRALVDEVLVIPAAPAEFAIRLTGLLRARGQSVRLKQQKEREIALLAKQNERLDEFAAVVSHDLRNPLTVVDGAIQLAVATGEMEHLDLARKAVDRMYELVDELLELARKGTLVDGTATVDFEKCARRAWESVPACGSRLRVVASYPLEADADRLGELLENLFRNAVEHGSAGGVPDRGEAVVAGAGEEGGVEVRLGPIPDPDDPGRVVGFFVEDDGPGIPEERRADVLRFGYTTREGGTGFGLTIVESIAGAHGWEVTVTESASGGARFEFRHGRRDHP